MTHPAIKWNEDEEVDHYIEAYFDLDQFTVQIRIGIEQEYDDHPIWICVSHAQWDNQLATLELEVPWATREQAQEIALRYTKMLVEDVTNEWNRRCGNADPG